ncbi:hypothetical protein ASF00_09290 [Sphingomonas sp. Leaf34]|uniref:hypothetical protein n=1 Tax=Sphingomonas sp. Leaf34 TaxID=1736216 RepID=UPI0007020FC4|nr:hypothetical protein [Sphingomonas sp. Leaf34]KQN28092.1 hypothetical protein ASF00_09290 [Sphingomonas sp. Leaf34]
MTDEPEERDFAEMEDDYYGAHDEAPRYEDASLLDGSELAHALIGLTLFDDTYLRLQAFNLAMVDVFLNQLERVVARKLFDEERTPAEAAFLNAQSQMWIFAAYEAMRTWRQRANDVMKWHRCGGLQQKLDSLEKGDNATHHGQQRRASMIRDVLADPSVIGRLDDDLKRTYFTFTRMEYLRVSLAKHEVSGKAKISALSPGYGRINYWCGSLDYELDNGIYSMGFVSRRDIADSLRAIPSMEVPTEEDLESFADYMKGPGLDVGNR